MKKTYFIVFIFLVLLFVSVGCGLVDRITNSSTGPANSSNTNSNKTLTDQALDTAVGEETVGIPECDEILSMMNAEANNPNDNFVTKAAKAVFFNRIKQSIKKSVEEHNGDKSEIAKTCKAAKVQFERFKAG